MAEIEIKPNDVWCGAFNWDGNIFREQIKTVMASYDRNDPRTWPLVKQVVQKDRNNNNNKDYRRTRLVPCYLAYEQSLMEDLVQHQPMKRNASCQVSNAKGEWMDAQFRDCPFNFDKKGQLRKHPHIPQNEFRDWMTFVMGTTLSGDRSLGVLQAVTTGQQELTLSTNISPTSAYEQIMKSLTDAERTSSTIMAKLEEELGKVKVQYRQEKTRADKAEDIIKTLQSQNQQLVTTCRAKVEAIEDEMRDLKASSTAAITEEKKVTKAAEDRLGLYEQQLKESNDKLVTARKEVMESNERIVTVWTKMQKVQVAGAWRRKTVDKATGPQDPTQSAACQLPRCESNARQSIHLTKKLEAMENDIRSGRKVQQATRDLLENAEMERDSPRQQVKDLRTVRAELKEENTRLKGVDLSNKRARCDSVPDEYYGKADKRPKRDQANGEGLTMHIRFCGRFSCHSRYSDCWRHCDRVWSTLSLRVFESWRIILRT